MYDLKNHWSIGERAWFEYHCHESHHSPDAQAWYHSHQQVTIVSERQDEGSDLANTTIEQRLDLARPSWYTVRFNDGLTWTVMEDELLTGPEHFVRPDPPASHT